MASNVHKRKQPGLPDRYRQRWKPKHYAEAARELVSSYGPDYAWEVVIADMITAWDNPVVAPPDPEELKAAILTCEVSGDYEHLPIE